MTERATLESAASDEPSLRVDPLIGRTLDGRYKIEKLLGEGGMGIVYKAVHTTLGKPLAIKVLRPEVSKNEEILQRFRQEAQSASQIGNPHIIDISDFGTLPDGSTYFVMEFLTGKSLTGALVESGGRLPLARAINVVRQLAGALAAAHEIGVVHRDLKPDNVQLIERGGQKDFVKVLDFGIAKVGGSTSKLTQAGQVFGTPHYMSPEQCAGTNVDQRTDIYAVGVMLYEMACGRVPFDADNLMGILTKHLYENPVPPNRLTPPADISPALEAVILKCLQKKPDQRYANMGELAADLDALDRGLPPKAMAEQVREAVAAAGPQTLTGVEARVTVGGIQPDIALHKNRAPLYFGLGTTAALIAAGLWLVLGSGSSRDQPLADKDKHAAAPAAPTGDPEATPPTAAVPTPRPGAVAAPDPEPKPAAPAQLNVRSSPEGAEVYVNGALMGKTPYALTKPNSGQTLSVQLRLAGHEVKTIAVTDSTSDVALTLAAEPKAPRVQPEPVRTRPTRPTRPANAPKPATTRPARPRNPSPSDVIDPWN